MKLKKPIWTMIWNKTPNSLKNIPKKIFRKKTQTSIIRYFENHVDNYIDNDKITANLKEYWRLCLLFLISRYLSYHNYFIFCPFLLFFLNLILSHITSWNLSTVCDDSHKGSFFEFPYILVFWTFGPKLHKDSNFLKHRLLLLSFTTLLLLIFFSLFIILLLISFSFCFQFFWALGSIFLVFLALIVMPTLGWRWLTALSTIPVVIFIFLCKVWMGLFCSLCHVCPL